MKRLLCTLCAILSLVFAQSAAADTYVFNEGANSITSYKTVEATYTVKNDGKVSIYTQEAGFIVKCNGTQYEGIYNTSESGYIFRYEVEAKANDVISIAISFAMSTSVLITESTGEVAKIAVNSISPEDKKQYNWNITSGMITIQFKQNVKLSGVKVNWNGNNYNVDDLRQGYSQFVSFNITNALDNAYVDGLVAGEPFTITLTGITDCNNPDNVYGEDGTLVVEYIAPHKQGILEKASVGGTTLTEGMNTYNFRSYYAEDDTDGLFCFEFTTPVKSVNEVKLLMGNLDQSTSGKYYYEKVKNVRIEGNKLYVDARGTLRSLARMFPTINIEEYNKDSEDRGYVNTGIINMVLQYVLDTNDNAMRSDGQGTSSTYSYTFNYKEIEDNIAMDGDREEDCEGTIKNGGERIQLWIDQQLKRIDALNVYIKVDNGNLPDADGNPVYGTGAINIPVSDIQTISSSAVEGTVIGFTLPELKAMAEDVSASGNGETKEYEAVAGETVRVVLQVTTENGLPHDLVINYMYKTDVSGIAEIVAPALHGKQAYNILGQPVDASAKGIIILNGKKIVK